MYSSLMIILVIGVWFLLRKRFYTFFSKNTKTAKYAVIFVFLLLTIFSVGLYLKYDKERAVYGLDSLFTTNQLPYGVSAKMGNYTGGIVLVDTDDFELAGAGFRYPEANFKTEDFLAYGYNDTSIVFQTTDSLKNLKYLGSYKTGYTSDQGTPDISFKELSKESFQNIQKKYRWVVVDEEKLDEITAKRFRSLLGVFICLLLLIWELIKWKNTPGIGVRR